MKITKRQLKRIIKEALSSASQKAFDDARKYRTKGEWRLRMPGTDQYLIPGWRSDEGMEVESFLGDKAKAKIFDNELSAEVDRDRIKKDPANATAGELEVEPASSKIDQIDPRPGGQMLECITKRQLRRIIKEEISTCGPTRRRMVDILFEDNVENVLALMAMAGIGPGGLSEAEDEETEEEVSAEEELRTFMQTPLASLPDAPAESLSDEAQALVSKGGVEHDADAEDDKKVSGASSASDKPVNTLFASQNEVGMGHSLGNPLGGVNATWDGINWGDVDGMVEMMKPGASITFSNALLGATTADGDVVLDGHHRWSQAFMVNPTGKVNIILSSAPDLTADETLKAYHLAILADTGQDKTKSASGGNLFDAGEDDIKAAFSAAEVKVDPETHEPSPDGVSPYIAAVMKLEDITDVEAGTAAAVARVASAIGELKGRIVAGAPVRDKMPQADGELNPISGEEAAALLGTGIVNIAEPFGESRVRHNADQLIMERWQELAGLIKG